MIWGTSIFLSNSGPVALRTITKMLQKIQEKYGNILGKYYLCQYGTQKSKMFEKQMYVPGTIFVVCFFSFLFLLKMTTYL